MIIVDVHEDKRFSHLIEEKGIKTERKPLEVGDYIIGNIYIERKSIRDFFSSLYQQRLFNQLHNLARTERPVLYIIGALPTRIYRRKRSILLSKAEYQRRYNTVVSVMARCWTSYHISPQWKYTESEFIDYLIALHSTTNKEVSYKPVGRKHESIPEVKSDILSCIPTVGRVVADTLSSRYSIHRLAEFSLARLEKVKVSGRKLGKKASKILEVLNAT